MSPRISQAAARGVEKSLGERDAPSSPHPTFQLLLDEELLITPGEHTFAVPSRALIDAIAAEWAAQGDCLDLQTMPLTRLANTAIDGVRGREEAVRGDITAYAESDLLCYRAEHPEALVARQCQAWDGVLAWAGTELGADLVVGRGLMPFAQPPAALRAIARALAPCDAFALTAIHVITTLTGSALLALATAHGHLPGEGAWAAAHVDEAFQISRWGEDAEARARHERRRREMQAACRMLELLAS